LRSSTDMMPSIEIVGEAEISTEVINRIRKQGRNRNFLSKEKRENYLEDDTKLLLKNENDILKNQNLRTKLDVFLYDEIKNNNQEIIDKENKRIEKLKNEYLAQSRELARLIQGSLRKKGFNVVANNGELILKVKVTESIAYTTSDETHIVHAEVECFEENKEIFKIEYDQSPRGSFFSSLISVSDGKSVAKYFSKRIMKQIKQFYRRTAVTPQ